MKLLAVLALFCILCCKAQKPAGEPIEGLVLLQEDGYSGVSEFEAHAISDQKVLERYYSQINRTRKPGLPVPVIDFKTEMALLIFLGDQQGGKQLWISKLSETETEMVLAVEIREVPSRDKKVDPGSLPFLQPFYLYKIPFTELKIGFKKGSL